MLTSFKRLFGLVALASACTSVPPEITADEQRALQDPPPDIVAEVEAKLPEALILLSAAEQRAAAEGRSLTEAEQATARQLGVVHPDRVRVLVTKDFPGQMTSSFASLFAGRQVGGLTTGYGIYLRPKFSDKSWILLHELVHVRQFEQLGAEGMMRRYLVETMVLPDNLIPIEREAIERSEVLMGEGAPRYAF